MGERTTTSQTLQTGISEWKCRQLTCHRHGSNTTRINNTTHQKWEMTKGAGRKSHSNTKSPVCYQDFYFQAGLLALLAPKTRQRWLWIIPGSLCNLLLTPSDEKKHLSPAQNVPCSPASGGRTTWCVPYLLTQRHKARSQPDPPRTELCSRWQKLCLTSSGSCRCQF